MADSVVQGRLEEAILYIDIDYSEDTEDIHHQSS